MYKYVTDVNKLSHHIIREFCNEYDVAIDATLGNGYDTDFLSGLFGKVYSFDIQPNVIESYKSKNKSNVTLVYDSHEEINKHVHEEVNCIMYNLGFLPGGDKTITTKSYSTINSLKKGIDLLRSGGIITIAVYRGHEEGKKEEIAVLDFVKSLPKEAFGVMLHSYVNRLNNPPYLVVIEKK